MTIIHKVNGVTIMSFKKFEEGFTFISQIQENSKRELEKANIPFDHLKSYIKDYLEAKKYCWHKEDEDYCSCCMDIEEKYSDYNFKKNQILNIVHPLTNKNMTIIEAIEYYFLFPNLEEKEVLRINGKIIELGEDEIVNSQLISEKVNDLLAAKTIVKSITINDKDISETDYKLYIKYKMDKYDAMYLVKSPKGHYGICLIVNTYHPLIQEAIYKIAEKTFYDTVVKSFMLIDSLKEITNL